MADVGPKPEKHNIYYFFLDRQLYIVIKKIQPSLKRDGVGHRSHVSKVVRAGGADAAGRMPKLVIANYNEYCNLTFFHRAEQKN